MMKTREYLEWFNEQNRMPRTAVLVTWQIEVLEELLANKEWSAMEELAAHGLRDVIKSMIRTLQDDI